MRMSIVGVFALCLMLLLCNCGNKEAAVTKNIPVVNLSTVQIAKGISENSYPGTTQAADESRLAFRVAGTLESIPVKVGNRVRKGQVLARMDSRDYKVQLAAAQAEYESTKAECERIISLYEDGGTSANNYDKARYGLEQITQKLAHAKDQVEDCVLYAPFDGYVHEVNYDGHETVGSGMPIVSVFADKKIEVVTHIPVSEYNRQSEYDRITATFSSPNRTVSLKLLNISKDANANQLYTMHLKIEDDDKEITPGLTAMVNIFGKEKDNLPLEIPSSAVLCENDQTYVYLYSDSIIHKTPVRVSHLSSRGTIQVIQGLEAGQKVVSAGVHLVSDGQRVRPASEPSKTNVGGLL